MSLYATQTPSCSLKGLCHLLRLDFTNLGTYRFPELSCLHFIVNISDISCCFLHALFLLLCGCFVIQLSARREESKEK